jgi:hypothetical protein
MQEQPLILTLKLDEDSHDFFDTQRRLYFPPERNFLKAHLTLFHQLPHQSATLDFFAGLLHQIFQLEVTGLMNLGAGVAYKNESSVLISLYKFISDHFKDFLILQDKQPLRPHVTVMNKTSLEAARALIAVLSEKFESFKVTTVGLDLWIYQNGPWQHLKTYRFT